MTLDHDTHDGLITASNLLCQIMRDLGLVLVVLQRIAMTAVDHKSGLHASLCQFLLGFGDTLCVVVCTLLSTTENDEAILITNSAYNRDVSRLGNGKEVVWVSDCANGVNGHIQRAIGSVLEADWVGETRCQLSVQLRLGRPCANGTYTEQICEELWRDGVEHFTCKRHALLGKVDEELT